MARAMDNSKWRAWRRRMERFARSRRSVTEFCREEGVSHASFYQWRKRLRAAANDETDAATAPDGAFVPLRLVGSARVTAHLPGGTRLEIPMDPAAFRLAIEALAEIDARRAGGPAC